MKIVGATGLVISVTIFYLAIGIDENDTFQFVLMRAIHFTYYGNA